MHIFLLITRNTFCLPFNGRHAFCPFCCRREAQRHALSNVYKSKFLPVFELDFTILKFTNTQFGSLHICHNRNMKIFILSQFPYCIITFFMFIMSTMTKIKTESISTGIYELFNFFF